MAKPKGRGRRVFGYYDRRHNNHAIQHGLQKHQELEQANIDEIAEANAMLDDGDYEEDPYDALPDEAWPQSNEYSFLDDTEY